MIVSPLAGDPELRNALQGITERHRDAKIWQQIQEVEALRARFGHSISLVKAVADARPAEQQSTCFMEALGLAPASGLMLRILRQFDFVYPGSEFVGSLIRRGLLRRVAVQPVDLDIVLYFEAHTPRHAGNVEGDAVISKWGLGHVWRHRLSEVPLSYGDRAEFFGRVDSHAAREWFADYARAKLGAGIIATLEQADA